MEIQTPHTEKMKDIYCHLEIPSRIQLDSNQVAYALNTFLQQHPEVWNNIFPNLEKSKQKAISKNQLPYISKEERDKIFLSLMEDEESEDIDINEIKSAHHDKNDSYYNFFKE